MHVSKVTKAKELASLFLTKPSEAFSRLRTVVEVQSDRYFIKPPKYTTSSIEEAIAALESSFGVGLGEFSDEAAELIKSTQKQLDDVQERTPITASHNGDFLLAKLCYLAVRLLKPRVVVETGVASGVTSTFMLSAMDKNGAGHLHSIDLPPLGPDVADFVGILVPESLRSRWTLHRGTSQQLMPDILKKLESLPIFVHDSLHTYRNILRELNTATPYLAMPAIVVSDDIDENSAFEEWAAATKPSYVTAIKEQQKPRLLGLAIINNEQPAAA